MSRGNEAVARVVGIVLLLASLFVLLLAFATEVAVLLSHQPDNAGTCVDTDWGAGQLALAGGAALVAIVAMACGPARRWHRWLMLAGATLVACWAGVAYWAIPNWGSC